MWSHTPGGRLYQVVGSTGLTVHGLTLLNEFYTNQDISLNMINIQYVKIAFKRRNQRDFYLTIDT